MEEDAEAPQEETLETDEDPLGGGDQVLMSFASVEAVQKLSRACGTYTEKKGGR